MVIQFQNYRIITHKTPGYVLVYLYEEYLNVLVFPYHTKILIDVKRNMINMQLHIRIFMHNISRVSSIEEKNAY